MSSTEAKASQNENQNDCERSSEFLKENGHSCQLEIPQVTTALNEDTADVPNDESMLDLVSKSRISLATIIESLFREPEDYILVYSKETPNSAQKSETGGPSHSEPNLAKPNISGADPGEEPKPKPIPLPGPEIDIQFRGKTNFDLDQSRSASEVRIIQEERHEFERKGLVSDSDDNLAGQLVKNRHLLEKLSTDERQLLKHFAELSDQLLYKIECVSEEVQAARDVFEAKVHGKSFGSCPTFELWISILKLTMFELKPPSHRKKELLFYVKTRLKEILDQIHTMSEVTSNTAIQVRGAQEMIGLFMNSWKTKFRPSVWAAVNDEKSRKLFAPPPSMALTVEPPTMARPRAKNRLQDFANEFTIQVLWTEYSGLVVRNLGYPAVFYPKFIFLDRRSVLNAMMKEVLSLVKQALLKNNDVAEMTRFGGTLRTCQLELNLMGIDGVLKKKETMILYPLEALMINQLRKIGNKFDELAISCENSNQFFQDKFKDILSFYRKRKKIHRGQSRKSNDKMAEVIHELQEVTLNFLIPAGIIDFKLYAHAENRSRQTIKSVVAASQASLASITTNATTTTGDADGTSQGTGCGTPIRTIVYDDSLAHLLTKNQIGPTEISTCSSVVQNFHSYCCDAITFLKKGIRTLGILQYNLFAPIGCVDEDLELVYMTGWLWILTKGIEHLLNQTPEGGHEFSQAVLALVPEYERVCAGVEEFQKSMANLAGKTDNTHRILQKLARQTKIRLYATRRTFISYGSRVHTEGSIKLEEFDVRIRLTAEGILIELFEHTIHFDQLPLQKCLEVLRIFMQYVITQVRNANTAAHRVQELRTAFGKENDLIVQWELYKMEKFLKKLNTGKLFTTEYEDDIVSGTVQSLVKELSRFQALVKYLSQKSTGVCEEIRHLEKSMRKLTGERFSSRHLQPRRFWNLFPNHRNIHKDFNNSSGELRMDLQIVAPILIVIRDSQSVSSKLTDVVESETSGVHNPPLDNEIISKSNFLREFIQKTKEINALISAVVLSTGQDLHLPNSAVEPEFQVSKIEAICALISNGILEMNHPGQVQGQPPYDQHLFEQIFSLLKEAENLEEVSHRFLEEKSLHDLKSIVHKLRTAMEIGFLHEQYTPHLFWGSIVKKNKSEVLVPEPEPGRSSLVIYWLTRDGDLELSCTNSEIEQTNFSTLSSDKRVKVILKLISMASDLCRSTYRNIEEWSKELKTAEELLKNLRKEVKQVKLVKYEEDSYKEKLTEILHEINLAGTCVENFRSTGKRMSSLLSSTYGLSKAFNSHLHLSHQSKVQSATKLQPSDEIRAKILKTAGTIKGNWFTPIKVEIPIHFNGSSGETS